MTTSKHIEDLVRNDTERLAHAAAIDLLRSRVHAMTGRQSVAIGSAIGRILAAPAIARQPVPAHTNSAVDGYAFAMADYDGQQGATLPIVGRSAAGHPLARPAEPGTAVRIFTGAVLPAGLDTIAMQEDCLAIESGGRGMVRLPPRLRSGANVRLAGEDVAQGSTLFEAGHILRPQDIAALASIGLGEVECRARLRIAIVATGDEIVAPGTRPLAPGEVYDANTPMLLGLCALAGAEVSALGIWPDNAEEVRTRLGDAATRFDVIMTSGGAGVGEEDHMSAAIAALGRRHLWQLAIKPGRPIMFGQVGEALVVGLPGNPVAVFVCFLMYVYPLLRALAGARWPVPQRLQLPAAFAIDKRKTGRREFLRGILTTSPDGQLSVEKYARDGSGLISGLRAADGIIELGEDLTGIAKGDNVAFIPFSEFGIVGR